MPHTKTGNASAPNGASGGGLGTFDGVFTPSILTILGVIMYLRFGWVVGNVGLWGTFLIVTLSTAITFLTGLSISAIATAQRVRVGGAYYMISRSLGIEAGGAVGIPLYFAQALSVALYTIGFAESIVDVFPSLDLKFVGILTTVGVALLALKSAKAAIRVQYFIMAAIALSLFSLFFGGPVEGGPEADLSTRSSFWVVFAVFFPAVTGIMAGVNLSGDLRDPGRSIPRGTLFAIGAGYLVYMTIPFFLNRWATPEQLIADPLIMRRMAFWGDVILLGVWGATLSSAVGSILGAPRVLQALARDGVLPSAFRFLGKGSGPEDEPRIGTAVTFGVALTAVLLGDLNFIAPVLTMFFLTTYGVLNVAAGLERFLGNPSFRPEFKVHWGWSLLGALGCVGVMFLINPAATVAATLIVAAIFLWLERQELHSAWGDVRRGIWMNLTRAGLFHIDATPDAKNWRPHLLVLSGAPTRRWHLIDFASSLSHNRAILTVSTVLSHARITTERAAAMETTIREYLLKHGVQALVRVVAAPNPFVGAERLVELYGLGALVPNTILLGDSENPEHRAAFCDMIAHFYGARRNTLVIRHNERHGFGRRRRIDVWWGGMKKNGSLMMILAYLLRTSLHWRGAEVRIKMVTPTAEAAVVAHHNLERVLSEVRTGAIPDVLVADGRPFEEILHASSCDADLVFLGMAEPRDGFVAYYEQLQRRVAGLPTTVFVLAAEDLAFGEVLLPQDAADEM
ncbi:Na-K-Cl cotransporter [Rhodocaloribacter sp.]